MAFRCIYTRFNAAQRDMECFNQLQMYTFDILNIKHWILIFKMIKKIKTDFKCEINTVSRCQKFTGNKWIIVTEPNHLMVDSFRNESPSCCSETQNSAVVVWNYFLVGEIQQKQVIWCLKCKSHNINLLFILLYKKINITFVIMLISEEKKLFYLYET